MKDEINNAGHTQPDNGQEDYSEYFYLEKKINVDRAAILDAISVVGNDKQKVLEYLINTRGL